MDHWLQLLVEEPDLLLGGNFAKISNSLHVDLELPYVLVQDVEGIGHIDRLCPVDSVCVYSVIELSERLIDVQQLVWGNFFFFESRSAAHSVENANLRSRVEVSGITVRAIDNTDLDIYTRSERVLPVLTRFTNHIRVRHGQLDEFGL